MAPPLTRCPGLLTIPGSLLAGLLLCAGQLISADSPRPFRWHALFQRAGDAVFVLDRRRRVLFVNSAWEQLTGLSAERARGLLCRRPRPAAATDLVEDVLAHILTPPAEVLKGRFARARRLFSRPVKLPAAGSVPQPPNSWDVEFLPFRQAGSPEGWFIVGRIIPLPGDEPQPTLPVPERLMDLRQRWTSEFTLDLLASTCPAMHRVLQQVAPGMYRSRAGFTRRRARRGQGNHRAYHSLPGLRERAFLRCTGLPRPAANDDGRACFRGSPDRLAPRSGRFTSTSLLPCRAMCNCGSANGLPHARTLQELPACSLAALNPSRTFAPDDSLKSCTICSGRFPSPFHPCASVATTCRVSSNASWHHSTPSGSAILPGSRPPRGRSSATTPGRAISTNCVRSSRMPTGARPASESTASTCPPPSGKR